MSSNFVQSGEPAERDYGAPSCKCLGAQVSDVMAFCPGEPGRGASMDVEAIPHEEDGRTEFSAKSSDKPKKVWGDDVFVGQERKVKSHSASPGGDGERRDHRDALMGASALIKDGRLSHGRPGATDECPRSITVGGPSQAASSFTFPKRTA